MKAMIFAAGMGTRLKPLTDRMPKALVPVAGAPLLEHVIVKLKLAGCTDILVNVHHFASQIREFLIQKENFGLHIECSDETECLLETGGGIRKGAWFFEDGAPFLVHNVDILSDLDLGAFYRNHLVHKAAATLLVSKRETARYLLFDEERNLKGWINEQTGAVKSPIVGFDAAGYERLAFGGVHIFSPELFPLMEGWPQRFPIIDFYLSVADKVAIKGDCQQLRWLDVGKLDSLDKAEAFFK